MNKTNTGKMPGGCRRVPGTFADGLARFVFTTRSGEGLLHDHARGCIEQGETEAIAVSMRVAGCSCGLCGEPSGKLS